MPQYTVTLDDGRKIKVEASSPQEAHSFISSQIQSGALRSAPRKMNALDITNASLNEFNRSIPGFDELAALGMVGRDSAKDMLAGRKNAPNFSQRWNKARANQEAISNQFNQQHPLGASTARAIGYTAPMLIPGVGEANASRLTTQVGGKAGQQATKAVVQYGSKKALQTAGQRAVVTNAPKAIQATNTINATKRPIVKSLSKGVTTASSQAALNAFADKGTLAQRAKASSQAATSPTVLITGGILGSLGSVGAKPPKQINPKVAEMIKNEIPLTYGQAMGGMAKSIEDKLTSAPIVGDAINRARGRGLDAFRTATINRSLAKIGDTLPDNISNGHEAMQYAGQSLGNKYNEVLGQATIKPTNRLRVNMANAMQGSGLSDGGFIAETAKNNASRLLNDKITSRIFDKPEVTGQELQKLVSGLRATTNKYKNALDPDQRDIGQISDSARRVLIDEAKAQNPNFAAQYDPLQQGYANYKAIERAAGGTGVVDGNFTPNQYLSAVRAADTSVNRGNFAKGRAFNQDFANAAVDILPNKVPDSGTAGRQWLLGGGLAGGAALTNPHTAPLAIGAGAVVAGGSAAYSKPALDLFNKYLTNQLNNEEAAILNYQINNDPTFRAMWEDLSQRAARSIGASQGQQQSQ